MRGIRLLKTMGFPASLDSRMTSRGVFGALIVAAHIVAAVLLARSTLVQQLQTTAPLEVALVDGPDAHREIPRLADPQMVPIQAVSIPAPEVTVPLDPDTHAITVTTGAPPATATPAQSSPGEPPSMSEVAYVRPPSPRYPNESRRSREEGLVVLRVLIDEVGHACRIEVVRSSGHPRLDAAARDAVEHAVFKPYLEGGIARAAHAMIPVEFSLRGGRS